MLAVADLAVAYGKRPVLHDVNLAVGTGQIVAVIGRNAVGKTTLLKAVMGLLPVLSGSVTLDGEDISALPPYHRARRGLGYVPQGRLVFADLTVHENLVVGAELDRRAGRGRIDSILNTFPALHRNLHRRAGTLSGGEQQMLALGRALVGGPKVLLLDEPSAGVAPAALDGIVSRLRVIAEQQGVPIILVEHNIEMVAALCSRACIMANGTLVEEIGPRQVHDKSIVRSHLAL